MDQRTQRRTSLKIIFHIRTRAKTGNITYLARRICVFLAALFLAGTEATEYAPQWKRSVRLGDNCSITEVTFEGCNINFNFFSETRELDCTNAPDVATAKCRFRSGNFYPDPCYGLKFSSDLIWKQDITASFAFCAEKYCVPLPLLIESGLIFISYDKSSVLPTTSTATFGTIHQVIQNTDGETTTDIRTTITPLTGELSAWKYVVIILSILLGVLLLILIYYRKGLLRFSKRYKRAAHSPNVPSDGQSHEMELMFGDGMETGDQMQRSDTVGGECIALQSESSSASGAMHFQGHSRKRELPSLSQTEVQEIRRELKRIYTKRYKNIKTCSPLDANEWMELDRIYTNLVLLSNRKTRQSQELQLKDLLKILKCEKQGDRVLLLGEAGVGKTSLLAKIAYDWAIGRCLEGICLLFLVTLREVEQNLHFGDYLQEKMGIVGWRIDEYIQKNQTKVMLLLDGLDEHQGDINDGDSEDAIMRILRGDKFPHAPIAVSTRPWKAEEITSSVKRNILYTLVEIVGFKKKDVAQYIRKFFAEDKVSAESLIYLINNDSIVSENMAPFPIFCNMLCYIWRDESKRQTIQRLKTFSQLIYEMVYFLQEHSFARSGEVGSFQDYRSRCNDSFKEVGKIAFYGLLERKLVFDGDAFESCQDAVKTACDVGVLTKEKRFAPKVIRQTQDVTHVEDIRFPHKLLQEYLAGFYLASLHHAEPDEFYKVVNEKLLVHYTEFRYLYYFTAAQGRAIGITLMDYLCKNVNDQDFIIDTAFECHDKNAITPAVNLLNCKSSVTIDALYMSAHTTSGYLFLMEGCHLCIRELTHSDARLGPTASLDYATGIFSIPTLRSLELEKMELADEFFSTMALLSSQCQIRELIHIHARLGPTASGDYATGIFSIPTLQSLHIYEMELADEFFSTMARLSSQCQIRELIHISTGLGPRASRDYATGIFSIPTLQSLKLEEMELADEFFSTMAQLSSQCQIKKFSISTVIVSALSEFARGIFRMPCLQSLTLDQYDPDHDLGYRMNLSEAFFSTMAELSPHCKINDLCHKNGDVDQTASREYARGVFSMPTLQTLTLENVCLHDEFFLTMAVTSSQSQIQELRMDKIAITQCILRILLSLPCLQSLTLCHVERRNLKSGISSEMPASISNGVVSLGVDATSIRLLCEWGLHISCPSIKTITLIVNERHSSVSDILTEFKQFPHLIELTVRKDESCHSKVSLLTSFCQSVMSACPGINKLSMTDITMGNETAAGTIRAMMAHESMTSIQLIRCHTNDDLDDIITEINKTGRLTVNAEHGKPQC